MQFHEITHELGYGKLIRRKSWKEDGLALKRYDDEIRVVNTNTGTLHSHDVLWSYLYVECDDWEVVIECPPSDTAFRDAMRMAHEGKYVRRRAWLHRNVYVRQRESNDFIYEKVVFDTNVILTSVKEKYCPTMGDILGRDWYDATNEVTPPTNVDVAEEAEIEKLNNDNAHARVMQEFTQNAELTDFYKSLVEDVRCVRAANFDSRYLFTKIRERYQKFDSAAEIFFLERSFGNDTKESDEIYHSNKHEMLRNIADIAVYAICLATKKLP